MMDSKKKAAKESGAIFRYALYFIAFLQLAQLMIIFTLWKFTRTAINDQIQFETKVRGALEARSEK